MLEYLFDICDLLAYSMVIKKGRSTTDQLVHKPTEQKPACFSVIISLEHGAFSCLFKCPAFMKHFSSAEKS